MKIKLRFGSQTQGKEPVSRKLQIQNTSCIPIQIDWKIFLINNSDKKLIDVNIVYQDNFDQFISTGPTPYSTNRGKQNLKNQYFRYLI